MKTRIISGIVMVLILSAILVGGAYFPIIITTALAILNVIAVNELLHNAVGIKSRLALNLAGVYSALSVFVLGGYTLKLSGNISNFTAITVVYAVLTAICTLINHESFAIKDISSLMAMPIALTYAFSSFEGTLNHANGIYYLLLLLNFSSICDTGAYFVGSTIGKHKLCPKISPKKTVEGAVGGIVSSLVVSVVLCLCFGFKAKLLVTLLLTVPFCILGMVGDLFASAIKRSAGIKDYGNLIPGHGGILDRMDSILMIAPLLFLFINAGVI